MRVFIFRRIAHTLALIVVLSYVCFNLVSLMPGDPLELMIASNPKITSEDVLRLKEIYGLDQPAYKRYLNWARTILQGDLGYSRTYKIPVSELMAPRLINTFILSLLSLSFSLLIAIPLGIFSAVKPGGKLDTMANLFSFAGISVPSFWLGLILIIIFAVMLQWLPAGGTQTLGSVEWGCWRQIGDRLTYLALPVLSLSLQQTGKFFRFIRSGMIEVLSQDYIRTAKAKGLLPWTILWKHAFRNTLIPLITVVALSLSGIFSGAVLTEMVFAYQGIGKLVYDSIMANDTNVAMVSFIISVSMVLLMNLLADILYGYADPRVSRELG
jgi:peptide/nickel transport system permease protein